MKYLLATAAVLALTSVSATGAERYQPNEAILHTISPPAEYDKPFVGKVEELIAKDHEELKVFCRGLPVIGCAIRWPASEYSPAVCLIYLAPDEVIRKYGFTTELIRRHEIAHCNGWRHPPAPTPPKIDPWSLEVSKP
jgi:hypothetical protein